VMWYRQNVATLWCWRLAESDVSVMPSVVCVWIWLDWWCKHADCGFPPSSALAFGMKMSDKCKSTHLVQCKWKICERNQYWSEIRHNKPT